MVNAGLGRWEKGHDGFGYLKPTLADLQNKEVVEKLRTLLQITPEQLQRTIPQESASQSAAGSSEIQGGGSEAQALAAELGMAQNVNG